MSLKTVFIIARGFLFLGFSIRKDRKDGNYDGEVVEGTLICL